MLEALDLSRALERREYKSRLPELQRRLHRLQRACYFAKIGNLVVVEGWHAGGKGSTLKKVTERLEPRALSVFATQPPRTFERSMPWMWRHWRKLPNWGEVAIFNRSWYTEVVEQRTERSFSRQDWLRHCRDIRFFEASLGADRYVITKLFLHISQEEQRRRMEKMAEVEDTAWRVDAAAWQRHERYGDYLLSTEETLQQTEAEWGPWTLVAATDKYWTRIQVLETLVRRLEAGLQRHGVEDDDEDDEDDEDPGDEALDLESEDDEEGD